MINRVKHICTKHLLRVIFCDVTCPAQEEDTDVSHIMAAMRIKGKGLISGQAEIVKESWLCLALPRFQSTPVSTIVILSPLTALTP